MSEDYTPHRCAKCNAQGPGLQRLSVFVDGKLNEELSAWLCRECLAALRFLGKEEAKPKLPADRCSMCGRNGMVGGYFGPGFDFRVCEICCQYLYGLVPKMVGMP